MALSTHTTNRYSSQRLINLTNPDLPTATSIDTARLGYAVDDVESEFLSIVGRAYDENASTAAQDINVAVEGVISKLMMRASGGESSRMAHEDYLEKLKNLRKRVVPKSTSLLTPTAEDRGTGQTVRPLFDRAKFDKFVPGHPRANDR